MKPVLLFFLAVSVTQPTDTRYVCLDPDGVLVEGYDSIRSTREACIVAGTGRPGEVHLVLRTEEVLVTPDPAKEWVVAPLWSSDTRPMYACDQACEEEQQRGDRLDTRTDPELVGRCEGPLASPWGRDDRQWQFHTNAQGVRGLTYCGYEEPAGPPIEPPVEPPTEPPALPELAGYGTDSLFGSIGSTICTVTSLEDSGPGSLRACLEGMVDGEGTTVHFDVGGTVPVLNPLTVRASHLTINGFTAPAPGITLDTSRSSGKGLVFHAFRDGTGAHDTLTRGIRIKGRYKRDGGDVSNAFQALAVDCENRTTPNLDEQRIAFDHVTVIDVGDSGGDIWGECHGITMSRSLLPWNRKPQSVSAGNATQTRSRISLWGNLYADTPERTAQFRGRVTDSEFCSNLVDGWTYDGTRIRNIDTAAPERLLLCNNAWLSGPGAAALAFMGASSVSCHEYGNSYPSEEQDRCTGPAFVRPGDSTPPPDVPLEQWAETFADTIGAPYRTAEEQARVDLAVERLESRLGVTPPEPCQWDPNLPADDPACVEPVEPCPWNPGLPADDPNCRPPVATTYPLIGQPIADPCKTIQQTQQCGDGVLFCPTTPAEYKAAWENTTNGRYICGDGLYHFTSPTNSIVMTGWGDNVTVGELPGTQVYLRGIGNVQEWEQGIVTSANGRDQKGFNIRGRGWRVHGIQVERFGTWGYICAQETKFHGVRMTDAARFGVLYGTCPSVMSDVIEFHFSALDYVYHGSIFNQRPPHPDQDGTGSSAHRVRLVNTYLGPAGTYRSGIDVRDNVPGVGDPDGSGNSDGVSSFTHGCPQSFIDEDGNVVAVNVCDGLDLEWVLIYDPGDDCVDPSGINVRMRGVVAIQCTPDGAMGVKIKDEDAGKDADIMGVWVHAGGEGMTAGFDLRAPTGASFKAFAHNAVLYSKAATSPPGQSWPTDTTKINSHPGLGVRNYRIPVANDSKNNNLFYYNDGADVDGPLGSHDWSEDAGKPEPRFVGPHGPVLVLDESPVDDESLDPRERFIALLSQVIEPYKLRDDSPLIDAGKLLPSHCKRPSDGPNPWPLNDTSGCWKWAGEAPDAYTFEHGLW